MAELISRAEAIAQGLKRYFTGKPCPKGHVAERRCASHGCVECERENNRGAPMAAKRRRYEAKHPGRAEEIKRRYRMLNPEKVKQTKDASRARRADQEREYKRRYTEANRARMRASDAEYRKANSEKVRNARLAWALANPEKVRESTRNWQRKNRASINKRNSERYHENLGKSRMAGRVAAATRRSRKLRSSEHYTQEDVQRLFELQRGRCAACRKSIKKGFHVDHVIALARGGDNGPLNIQLLCQTCNCQKNARDPIEFNQSRGLLL